MNDYILIKKISKKGYTYYSLRIYFTLNGCKYHKDYVLPFENDYAMREVLLDLSKEVNDVE